MRNKNDYSSWIEAYLDGELTTQEQHEFERELESNASLKEEFDYYNLAQGVVQDIEQARIKSIIKEVQNNYSTKKTRITRYIRVSILVAMLSLGLVFSYYLGKKDALPKEQPEKTKNKIEPRAEKPTHLPITPKSAPTLKEVKTPVHNIIQTDTLNNEETVDSLSVSIPTETEHNIELKTPDPNQEEAQPNATPSTDNKTNTPCDGIAIQAEIRTEASCNNSKNGVIQLLDISGGKPPYRIKLNKEEWTDQYDFYDLAVGDHVISVMDKNQCQKEFTTSILSKNCKLDLYTTQGEPLIFPPFSTDGVLRIYDKKGELQYEIPLEAHISFEWDTETNNGLLGIGYYLFMINLSDGKTQQGSITITP